MRSRRTFIRNVALAVPAMGTMWPQRNSCVKDPRIQHIVVLMLENRSFDHMLGYTFRGKRNGVDGLPDDFSTLPPNIDQSTERPVPPAPEAEYAGDFDPDPGHDFCDVMLQMFSKKHPASGDSPKMEGFVASYLVAAARFAFASSARSSAHRLFVATDSTGAAEICATLLSKRTPSPCQKSLQDSGAKADSKIIELLCLELALTRQNRFEGRQGRPGEMAFQGKRGTR